MSCSEIDATFETRMTDGTLRPGPEKAGWAASRIMLRPSMAWLSREEMNTTPSHAEQRAGSFRSMIATSSDSSRRVHWGNVLAI